MIKSLGDSEYTHSIDIGGGSLEMNLRENSMTIQYWKGENFYENSCSGDVWDWSDWNYRLLHGIAFDKYITKKMKEYLEDWFGDEFFSIYEQLQYEKKEVA